MVRSHCLPVAKSRPLHPSNLVRLPGGSRGSKGWLIDISERSAHGIFSLRILGRGCIVICNGSVLEQIYKQPSSVLDDTSPEWAFLCRVFGADAKCQQAFLSCRPGLRAHPVLDSALSHALIQSLRLQLPNLVSFSESIVDQNPWERSSNAEVIGGDSVDADLYALVRVFVGHMLIPSLLGSDFLNVYPGVIDDLRDLGSSLKFLLLGLPRWFPLKPLAKANIARHRLDKTIDSYHTALDRFADGDEPNQPWTDLSDASQCMKARSATWRGHRVSPNVKGPSDLCFLWACVLHNYLAHEPIAYHSQSARENARHNILAHTSHLLRRGTSTTSQDRE